VAYVRRLPSGKWQATVRGPDGNRHTYTHALKSTVRAWASEQESARARGTFRDPRAGNMPLGEWLDRWLAARVVEPATLAGDRSTIHNHLLPAWERWPLAEIAPMDVQAWVRRMTEAGVGPSTIRRSFNLLTSLMGAAVDNGLLAVSPCRRIDLPTIAVQPPRWWTREQAAHLLNAHEEPWAAMVDLGLHTGLRWGELAGLRAGSIDWLRGRLFVVDVVTRGRLREYPKSAGSRREVPIPAGTLDRLGRHAKGLDPGDVVFTTTTKGRAGRLIQDGNWRTYVWWPAMTEVNDPVVRVPPYPPHSMRHTCASWLVQAGVSLYEVQALLGHESHATTQRYAHLAPDSHSAVMDAWARIERADAPMTHAAGLTRSG